jgi:ABC-type sugar transport system substrate-binding protein
MEDHNEAVISRLQGIEDVLRKQLGIQEEGLRRVSCPNESDAAVEALEPFLATMESEKRVLVFGFNAVAALAATSAVERGQDTERFAVVGQNLTAEIRKELRRPDSRLIGTVTYHPERYGAGIMELVRKILNGEPVGPSHFTRHEWIPASRLAADFG